MPAHRAATSHPALDLVLEEPDAAAVDRTVADADEMLGNFETAFDHNSERALAEYFRTGRNISYTLRRLAAATAPEPHHAVLDFGCGYGRVARFLAPALGAERLFVSDVYADALAFQQRRFGVQTIPSSTSPGDFSSPRRFRLIFSISVFTHLPEPSFHTWLAKLVGLLEPGGVLAFTTHSEALLAADQPLPASGLRFVALSESRSLDQETYGSTWVSERFVRAAVERTAPGAQVLRVPRGLCDYQDLYLVAPPGSTLPAPSAVVVEPSSFLEQCGFATPGSLVLQGWAEARFGPPLTTAEVVVSRGTTVDRQRVPFVERPDVAATRHDDTPLLCGWRAVVEFPTAVPHSQAAVAVWLLDSAGARFLVYASPLEGALLDGARRHVTFLLYESKAAGIHHRTREAALQARLDFMESTAFWRLRNWLKTLARPFRRG